METERAEQNQELTKRDAHLANLNQMLAERDAHLANLNQTLADRDSNLAGLNQALGERDHELASLTQALAELTSSHSWRLTRPLRFVGRLMRGNLKIEKSKVNEIKAENELLH